MPQHQFPLQKQLSPLSSTRTSLPLLKVASWLSRLVAAIVDPPLLQPVVTLVVPPLLHAVVVTLVVPSLLHAAVTQTLVATTDDVLVPDDWDDDALLDVAAVVASPAANGLTH